MVTKSSFRKRRSVSNAVSKPTAGNSTENWVPSEPLTTAAQVVLSIVAGPHSGEEFKFQGHDTLMVGRAPDATWCLNKDPHFSRYHFRVEANPPVCRLIDLRSRNGTVVNGRRVTEAELHDGDVIKCGATRIAVKIKAASPQRITAGKGLTEPRLAGAHEGNFMPEHIAEFQITGKIGEGGMGVVYEAIQRPSGRKAAVKVILPVVAVNQAAVKLFLREASILTRLQHKRIVECLGVGLHEGRMYLAMERIATIDLRQVLSTQPRARQIRVACGIVCQMLEGLTYAHAVGIVHRDVKPGNILVYRNGNKLSAKLGDFGLAKSFLTAGFSSISRDTETRGTLAYMPPEQVINCRYAEPPCDIYAVGACLYFYLTFRPGRRSQRCCQSAELAPGAS